MTTLFDIIKQNKEGSKSSIPVLQSGGLFENFKKGLGLENNNNYSGRNSNSSAVGKYQFLWGEWGDRIKRVTGVKSKDGFENSPKAQEEFFSWYFHNTVKPNVEKIKKDNKLGLRDEEIAALIHFQGEGNAKKIISSGSHSKATSINPSSAEYLKRFNKHLGSQTSSSSEYIAEDSPYSKYDFSNQKLDYSQMNAQMESNQAFQKAMVEAMQSEASSKIALNQAQTLAIEREQAEKLALQEEEKKKAEQEQIQSVLDEKNKQREMLMEVGLQAIPEFIEKDTNVLNQIASSPMNFQFQGGFQQLVQGQEGGEFETINLDEVVVKAETPLTKLGKEFEKNNNYSEFVYGKPQTMFDSYQGRQKKYEKLKIEYIANEISKQYTGKRGRILNEIRNEYGDEMHDFVITNSTNRDVRENVYDNFMSGVLNMNGSFNPYRSNREQSKRGNVLLDRLGDIGDISSPLSVPYNVALGKKVTNSKGETDYTYSDAFSGVVPKEREMTAEIAGDPLNLLGIGIADDALRGFKGIRDVLKITPKLTSEGVEAKNMLKAFYPGKTYLQDIDKYRLNTLLNDESGREALFKHIVNRDNTFFRGVNPEHPEAIRVAREAGIDINDKDAIIKHIAGTIPNETVGARASTKQVDGLDELYTTNHSGIASSYTGKYNKTAIIRKPTNFKGSRLDWLINNSNTYETGSGKDLKGATAFSEDVVPRDNNIFRFQGKPNEKILDVIDIQPVDKLHSDIKKGIRYNISAQGSPVGNNLSSDVSNKLDELYNKIITRKNPKHRITEEEINIFSNAHSKGENSFKGGGMFNKMYDEYNKININSFKAKFIKSTTHGGFAGKG